MKVKKTKRESHTGEKRRKGTGNKMLKLRYMLLWRALKKEKASIIKKRKNKDKSLVRKRKPKGEEVDLEEQSVKYGHVQHICSNVTDGVVDKCHSSAEEIQDFGGHRDLDTGAVVKSCRSKKDKKKGKRRFKIPWKREKEWIMEYHQSRPGLEVLQRQIDDFITAHEEKLEELVYSENGKKRKRGPCWRRGWTVVVHHKGRKKTTDSETGIAVGSVAQAAVENKMTKKKRKEVGLDFYRFQKEKPREMQILDEIMTLQSKFEDDKKRLQQMRAARKFRPY
ncbi:hypothetical protein ACSQ67_023409 [Phaseolus vulgaris]